MIYWQLFISFFQIGLFAIGGGLATLPFLQQLGLRTHWYTMQDLANMIAISESTPGPIGINMATYAGYLAAGIPGAVAATFSLVLPATIIVLIVARFLQQFNENRLVQDVFYGLRAASLGLISAAALSVLTISLFNLSALRLSGQLSDMFEWKSIALAIILFFAMKRWKLHPVIYIAISAAVGITFSFAGK